MNKETREKKPFGITEKIFYIKRKKSAYTDKISFSGMSV